MPIAPCWPSRGWFPGAVPFPCGVANAFLRIAGIWSDHPGLTSARTWAHHWKQTQFAGARGWPTTGLGARRSPRSHRAIGSWNVPAPPGVISRTRHTRALRSSPWQTTWFPPRRCRGSSQAAVAGRRDPASVIIAPRTLWAGRGCGGDPSRGTPLRGCRRRWRSFSKPATTPRELPRRFTAELPVPDSREQHWSFVSRRFFTVDELRDASACRIGALPSHCVFEP